MYLKQLSQILIQVFAKHDFAPHTIISYHQHVQNIQLELNGGQSFWHESTLTLLHSERPKLYAILAFLSALELNFKQESL